MGAHTATAVHQDFRNDLIKLLDKYAGKLSAEETLALAAHLVGQIIALQDQRKMTRERVWEIVSKNIEQGNAEVVIGEPPQGSA